MILRDVLKYGEERLAAADIADAKIDAFTLLEMVSGINRTSYLLNQNQEMSEEQINSYKELIEKRAGHIPCQYITGTCEFMGYSFMVNPSVLIPRQDTETLVEEVLKILPENSQVLDMCTGSGAIAIALSLFRPSLRMTAVDISEDALKVARTNGQNLKCSVDFVQSDLFQQLDAENKFDAIISNPPYISESEYESLMPEVKEHEPELALKAGEKGLDIYQRLIKEATGYLNKEGFLALEIGCSQAEDVSDLMKLNGFTDIKVVKDLAGLDRVVIGWLR